MNQEVELPGSNRVQNNPDIFTEEPVTGARRASKQGVSAKTDLAGNSANHPIFGSQQEQVVATDMRKPRRAVPISERLKNNTRPFRAE